MLRASAASGNRYGCTPGDARCDQCRSAFGKQNGDAAPRRVSGPRRRRAARLQDRPDIGRPSSRDVAAGNPLPHRRFDPPEHHDRHEDDESEIQQEVQPRRQAEARHRIDKIVPAIAQWNVEDVDRVACLAEQDEGRPVNSGKVPAAPAPPNTIKREDERERRIAARPCRRLSQAPPKINTAGPRRCQASPHEAWGPAPGRTDRDAPTPCRRRTAAGRGSERSSAPANALGAGPQACTPQELDP